MISGYGTGRGNPGRHGADNKLRVRRALVIGESEEGCKAWLSRKKARTARHPGMIRDARLMGRRSRRLQDR